MSDADWVERANEIIDKLPDKPKKKEEETDEKTVTETKQKVPPRNAFSAFLIGVVAPLFVMWVAYKLYPHVYHKDVLGGVHDF